MAKNTALGTGVFQELAAERVKFKGDGGRPRERIDENLAINALIAIVIKANGLERCLRAGLLCNTQTFGTE